MEKDEALNLAVLRAKTVAVLLIQPRISSVTDNYSKEKLAKKQNDFVTKYVNFYRINAALNVGPQQFEVIEQFNTSFDEVIVLMKFNAINQDRDQTDSLMLQLDNYQAERQQKNRFEFEEKCEVYGLAKTNVNADNIELFYYYFSAINQFYEIVSRYNGDDIDFPQNVFRYQAINVSGEENLSFDL
jgi:hypothetical protein